ncbi:hypothetical protein OIU77_010173 [Salix suchowensis]|uniref:Uncharacterized protein n=1 Tax=Salix suchowensis TaxID=1278906 RepID=A0ABQ9A8H8_9ROSI|nr:hypothetical protein OIU77_010173 [Salix suchowensis]
MRKIRGFKIGKRLVRISTWIFRRTRIHPPDYNLLGQSESTSRSKPKPISKIINWGRRLTKGAKSLCCSKPGSGYIPMGHELVCDKPVTVPSRSLRESKPGLKLGLKGSRRGNVTTIEKVGFPP